MEPTCVRAQYPCRNYSFGCPSQETRAHDGGGLLVAGHDVLSPLLGHDAPSQDALYGSAGGRAANCTAMAAWRNGTPCNPVPTESLLTDGRGGSRRFLSISSQRRLRVRSVADIVIVCFVRPSAGRSVAQNG